jgi:hypothetical protein
MSAQASRAAIKPANGSFGDFAQEGLQLGIDLFDRVHV